MSGVRKLAILFAFVLVLVFGATALAQATSTVQVAQNSTLGNILVDGKGMTLYYYTKDTPGVSNCTGGCLAAWPPLTVTQASQITAGSGVTAKLATITRPDGALQVTANDMPLYYWAKDKAPGEATGQNVGGVWFVSDPAGNMVKTAAAAQAQATVAPTTAAAATTAPTAAATEAAAGATAAPAAAATAAPAAGATAAAPAKLPTTGGSSNTLLPLLAAALVVAGAGFGLRLARRRTQ